MLSVEKMIFVAVLLAFVACVRGLSGPETREKIKVSPMPKADGLFHVYALPIGQGDARVIQCPSGLISIFDMGTCSGIGRGFWTETEIRIFLQGHFSNVTNIFLTHNDKDHYNLLDKVFDDPSKLTGLQFIYISGVFNNTTDDIKNWVNNINAKDKVTPFNNGRTCGSSSVPRDSCDSINNENHCSARYDPCDPVDLCPEDERITTKVLSVNAGQKCKGGSNNADSIVMEITYDSFKLQLNGDFEDCTDRDNEDGPQKAMADFYGSQLEVTVYMLAHHGAQRLANKKVIRDAVRPRAVFVSADPWHHDGFRHPRCAITDAFIYDVQSLCKPGETDKSSRFYCGQHPWPSADNVQSTYSCGRISGGEYRTINNNDYAIYSTTPDSTQFNLVHLLTNGTKWGFVNNISPRIKRQTTSKSSKTPEAEECFDEN